MTEQEQQQEEKCSRLVSREVHYCVSSLVSTLAQGYGQTEARGDLAELCEQAFALASPIQDYESAAFDDGWREVEDDGVTLIRHETHGQEDGNDDEYDDWQECCDRERIEPHDREVYEHWIVSDWLASKLREQGEKIDDDFGGMTVWARCTTGQAISIDGVIRAIQGNLDRQYADMGLRS